MESAEPSDEPQHDKDLNNASDSGAGSADEETNDNGEATTDNVDQTPDSVEQTSDNVEVSAADPGTQAGDQTVDPAISNQPPAEELTQVNV